MSCHVMSQFNSYDKKCHEYSCRVESWRSLLNITVIVGGYVEAVEAVIGVFV